MKVLLLLVLLAPVVAAGTVRCAPCPRQRDRQVALFMMVGYSERNR